MKATNRVKDYVMSGDRVSSRHGVVNFISKLAHSLHLAPVIYGPPLVFRAETHADGGVGVAGYVFSISL